MAESAQTKAKASETDSTSGGSRNRFVVSLPAEVGDMIDELGAKLAEAFERETGIAFELSRAQVVQAAIRQAYETSPEDEAQDNGGQVATEAQKAS